MALGWILLALLVGCGAERRAADSRDAIDSVRDRLGVRESSEAPAPEVLEQLKALGYLE
jgi:hypothetical protein